jgi:hypothetical protein
MATRGVQALRFAHPRNAVAQTPHRRAYATAKTQTKYDNVPWNCCVARPVFKDEIRRCPGAQAALRKEWDRLRAINTWLEDEVEEWDVVKARAKRQGVKIHMGMVFQICGEKDSETEKEE